MKVADRVYHVPVMVEEVIDHFITEPNGAYVDATFGGGGHSREILKRLGERAKLFVFDQDPDALKNLFEDARMVFCQANFRYMANFLDYYNNPKVDGIFADLGISSYQIDTADRGFSFNAGSDLDMRMKKEVGKTAADYINEMSEKELQNMFSEYGEVRNARQVARKIVEGRKIKKIETVPELCALLEGYAKPNRNKFFAQVFQAIRIKVNDEIGALQDFLKTTTTAIRPGGRLVVLSYHSLEDRLVKNVMKSGNLEGQLTKDMFGNVLSPFRPLFTKPLLAKEDEIRRNSRSRSAKLRAAERTEYIEA